MYAIQDPQSIHSGHKSLKQLCRESMLDFIRKHKPTVNKFFAEERFVVQVLLAAELIVVVSGAYQIAKRS